MSHRSLFIIVLVLLFCFSARSQESNTPLRGLDESAVAAGRKKAFDLLETVAGQVNTLRAAENRARIGSNAAEALWDHDEKRARSLFAAVEEDIKIGFNDTDSDDSAHTHTLMVFWQLRSDTIARIAKHDPDLALRFLRATRLPVDAQLPPYVMGDTEKSLELRLAGQVAAKNPQLALKLGRQSLDKGFSNDLLLVLFQLHAWDRAASLTFYKEIVDKLKSVSLVEDSSATDLALELAKGFQPPAADEQIYRDLIGVVLAGALANGCGKASAADPPEICYSFGSVVSKIEKYYGQGAAPLKRWAEATQGFEDPWLEIGPLVNAVVEKGTVDDVLALGAKYPEWQYQIQWAAMTKAKNEGDTVKARQIASNFPEEARRSDMLEEIEQDQMWNSMNADKLALVQQALSRLRNNEERIQFLFQVTIKNRGKDRKAALGLLDQAGQMINSSKPGRAQLEGQIVLAMMYCSMKSDRAFAIMESLMPRINELVAASATLDGFENSYLRDGEWNMTAAGDVGRLLTALAQNAGYFAALDFDRSVDLAGQLERPELRLMAKLKIAQGVLTAQPNPAPMFRLP